jgi:hypothetical protein
MQKEWQNNERIRALFLFRSAEKKGPRILENREFTLQIWYRSEEKKNRTETQRQEDEEEGGKRNFPAHSSTNEGVARGGLLWN